MMDATGIKSYFQFQNVDWQAMRSATWETIWMTVVAAILVVIIGLLLGVTFIPNSQFTKWVVKNFELDS